MRILLLTQVLPYPPDSGPKIKTWNVLKYLAKEHEITLVSFVRGDQSADVRQLEKYCRAIHTVPMTRSYLDDGLALIRSLASGQPWLIARDSRIEMRKLVARLTNERRYDVVHADQLNMAQYAAQASGVYKLLDAHNALWLLYKRLWQILPSGPQKWLLARDWRLLRAYEGRICREFDFVLAVSESDKAALEEAAGKAINITVIPIAVDVDEIQPVVRRQDASHILHIGTMYWPPNIDGVLWFIREVFPRIRARRPDVVFDVIGARPPRALVELSGDGTGINVTGYVRDPTSYFEQAGVMVVPVRAGGGIRVKILEALALQLPVVTTRLGCEGIAVESGRHLIIADEPGEFAEAVLHLLDNRRLADALGQNGRRLIEAQYDYRMACRPLDRVYQTLR